MTAVKGARDWRIDWLRGLALVMILVNHMPGNRLENWTSRNIGLSDAAEIFVLLAGVAAALAFFKRFEAGDAWATSVKAARRARTLYLAHVGSTLAAVALFALTATVTGNPDFLDLIGVAPLFADPWPGLLGLATGGFQLGYFNILPMYVVLLAMLPGLLWLAVKDLRLMLLASTALYVAAQVVPLSVPNFPVGGGWFFNPFAWQLLFAIGLALGVMRLRGQSVPYHHAAFGAALAYIVFGAVWMIWSLGGHLTYGVLPPWMDTLHKSALPPTRLLHVMALAYVLVHSPLWQWLTPLANADKVITRIGRNSLPAFIAGSLASMAGYIVLVQTGSDLAIELLLTVLGVAAMWTAASVSEIGVASALARLQTAALATLAFVRRQTDQDTLENSDPVTTIPTARRR
jgi:hypothetical protein